MPTKSLTSRIDHFLVQKLPLQHESVMSALSYHKSLNAVLLLYSAIPVPVCFQDMLMCGLILLYT